MKWALLQSRLGWKACSTSWRGGIWRWEGWRGHQSQEGVVWAKTLWCKKPRDICNVPGERMWCGWNKRVEGADRLAPSPSAVTPYETLWILFSRSVLSNRGATSHTWLLSTWNVTSPNWDASIKHTTDFKDCTKKEYRDNFYSVYMLKMIYWICWVVCMLRRFSHVNWLFATPWTVAYRGSSVHGISQARIPEWIVVSSFRGSSWPGDRTPIFCVSCISGNLFTTEPYVGLHQVY